MKSYRPWELFDGDGFPAQELELIRPRGPRRMSALPAANGGELLRSLMLPPLEPQAIDVSKGRGATAEATRALGGWLAEVIRLNPHNFRIFGPDETASNRLDGVYSVTAKQWQGTTKPSLSRDTLWQ